MNPGRLTRLVVTVLLVVAALTACGGEEESTSPTATSEPQDARTLLEQGSDALDEVDSLRFNLEVEGTTYVDAAETIRLLAARGDLVRPGSVDVQFQAELLGAQTVSIRLITVDDQSWTTNLVSGEWEPAPEEFGYNPAVLFDEAAGLSTVARQLEDPTLEGQETIGGRETWRVSGSVTDEVIGPLTSNTLDGEMIGVTIWLDQGSHDILRLRVAEPEDAPKEDPATWTMTLTGHGEDLTVEPPELDG